MTFAIIFASLLYIGIKIKLYNFFVSDDGDARALGLKK